MKNERSTLLVIATALFLPPLILPTATAKAQTTATVTAAPKIERFDLDPPTRLMPGEALIFRITGTPRANASVTIDGVNGKVALREVMPGIYEGVYTLKAGDRIDAYSAVKANLQRGHLELSTALNQPLVETSAIAVSR